MKALLSAVIAVSIAASSHAALSKEYADFPAGPAQLFLTKEEVTAWKSVQTDEQAKAFIDLFWARRDPTPGTPANEFRQGFEERVTIADGSFAASRISGSATDRGKVFVLLGAPTKRRKTERTSSTIQTPTSMPSTLDAAAARGQSVQGYSPKELWIYEQGRTAIPLGQPIVEIVFIDQYGSEEWKLEHTPSSHPAAFETIARSFITQPDLKEVPVFAAVSVAAPPPFKNPALAAAIDELRAGKAASSPNVFVTWGEYVTPAGQNFVPVQLYASSSSGLEGGAKGTFFGRVEKPDGEAVSIFERPATLIATTGGVYVDASLALTPGEYHGTFGFAREGSATPVLTSSPLKVSGLDKDAAGVSTLILSNDIQLLKEAQAPMDPYAFGGLKVVPKSDAVFRRADELWYFVELRNPGIDATTNEPKLLMKLTLTGKTAQGAAVKMATPPEETPARELKGVPGHWAVGQSMPLESFHAGEYTLAIKVTDLTTKASYDMQAPFRIVE